MQKFVSFQFLFRSLLKQDAFLFHSNTPPVAVGSWKGGVRTKIQLFKNFYVFSLSIFVWQMATIAEIVEPLQIRKENVRVSRDWGLG